MDASTFRQIVCEAVVVHADEISCHECFEVVDRFAELSLQGQDAEGTMPLVQQHLALCRECHEEYEVLLFVLRATATADRRKPAR